MATSTKKETRGQAVMNAAWKIAGELGIADPARQPTEKANTQVLRTGARRQPRVVAR